MTLCSNFWVCFLLQSLDKPFSGCCIVWGMCCLKRNALFLSDVLFPYILQFPVVWQTLQFLSLIYKQYSSHLSTKCQLLLQADWVYVPLEKTSHNLPKEIIQDILHWKIQMWYAVSSKKKKVLQWPQESHHMEFYDTEDTLVWVSVM